MKFINIRELSTGTSLISKIAFLSAALIPLGPRILVHLRANIDNINPILPLGNILPQMNANQRKWVEIDSSLSTVPDRFAFIGVDLRLNLL